MFSTLVFDVRREKVAFKNCPTIAQKLKKKKRVWLWATVVGSTALFFNRTRRLSRGKQREQVLRARHCDKCFSAGLITSRRILCCVRCNKCCRSVILFVLAWVWGPLSPTSRSEKLLRRCLTLTQSSIERDFFYSIWLRSKLVLVNHALCLAVMQN